MAWTILALFYDSHGNEIRAEHAFLEAHRLNILAAVKKRESEKASAEKNSDIHSISERGGECDEKVYQCLLVPATAVLPKVFCNARISRGITFNRERISAFLILRHIAIDSHLEKLLENILD